MYQVEKIVFSFIHALLVYRRGRLSLSAGTEEARCVRRTVTVAAIITLSSFIELRAFTKAYCLISCTVTTGPGEGDGWGRQRGLYSDGTVTRVY